MTKNRLIFYHKTKKKKDIDIDCWFRSAWPKSVHRHPIALHSTSWRWNALPMPSIAVPNTRALLPPMSASTTTGTSSMNQAPKIKRNRPPRRLLPSPLTRSWSVNPTISLSFLFFFLLILIHIFLLFIYLIINHLFLLLILILFFSFFLNFNY